MKIVYKLALCLLPFFPLQLFAQSGIYSQAIDKTGISLRGGTMILGDVTATFPSDGMVVVHFDGECYASVGDRIILAATNTGDWAVLDGQVSVETSKAGFGRPFSHTRVYPVTAGIHTYNAVAQNAVETDGNGMASIYGTLTVEYFPDSGTSTLNVNTIAFSGDVTDSKVVAQQFIHANGPGNIVLRFDGYLTSAPGDRIVLAASNTPNWSFNDGNVSVEAVNEGDVDENSFSHTRVYNVPSAGEYTYYGVSQVYGETGGNHMVSIYATLLIEYFPTSGSEKILFQGFTLPAIDLNGQSTEITTLTLDAPVAGKVMVGLDGYMTASQGYQIVLAASNNGLWTNQDGSLSLEALDNDQNRYSFSHTRVYNVAAGSQTLYAVGQIFGGSGNETADLFGELTVKYIPNSSTAVHDLYAGKNEFDIFPNPSKDIVHIAFNNPLGTQNKIQILGMNGHLLREYPGNSKDEINIDLSTLSPDVYWIKVGEFAKAVVKM
ncbi:MAG: T9SS type A sorting domain-containing protein [Saprospiraceae bacterium]